MKITDAQISAMAVNDSALANGKKIYQSKKIFDYQKTQDDTLYMAQAKGSGKSDYRVSVDFLRPGEPVCRCSCPSRQIPCKHAMALLFAIKEEENFALGEVPEDIIQKREKIETRERKKEEKHRDTASSAPKKKPNAAARTKKIQKQLEGLDLMQNMIKELLLTGLGSAGGISLKNFSQTAKQLGDYYLPGPLNFFNTCILALEKYQKTKEDRYEKQALEALIRLRAIERKARVYLTGKLEQNALEVDGDPLFEELGGIYRLEDLGELGLVRKPASLIQLGFDWVFHEGKKEYEDRGYFLDLTQGDVVITSNFIPLKASKYIKEDAPRRDVLLCQKLYLYPGNINPRVRWENCESREAAAEDMEKILAYEQKTLEEVIKTVKSELKNLLSREFVAALVSYERIGKWGEELVLTDTQGKQILLRDCAGENKERSLDFRRSIAMLPDMGYLKNGVLFGLFFYDSGERKIYCEPLSLITRQGILRLKF